MLSTIKIFFPQSKIVSAFIRTLGIVFYSFHTNDNPA